MATRLPLTRPTPFGVGLVVGVLCLVTYRLVPVLGLPDAVQTAVTWIVGAAGACCVLLGVRLYRPAYRLPWILIALSPLSALGGDLIYYGASLVGATLPFPSPADLCYLLAYPLEAAGLILLIRRRTPGWNVPTMIDATIVTISASLLSWTYLIAPAAGAPDLGLSARVVLAAYPLGDLLLLSIAARLLLGAGHRPPALRLLTAYLVLVIVPDALYGLQVLGGTYAEGGWTDTLWQTSEILLCVAALHPSMNRLDERSPVDSPDVGFWRLTILAVASLLAPATLFVQYLRGEDLHVPLVCAVCAMLFLLVIGRLAGMIAAQRNLAITDGLTGLRTRRYFEHTLVSDVARASRGGEIAVMLLDIDHFKSVNDTYGHHGGDRVLCEVARRLLRVVRAGDLVARYGGEEFAVLLPATGPGEAHRLAERVRKVIGTVPMPVSVTTAITVTVSIGVATLPNDARTAPDLMLHADKLLYVAKDAGRDRVVVSDRFRPDRVPNAA